MNLGRKYLGMTLSLRNANGIAPLEVWNAPSWPLKGDNWKIQDEATVKVGTL